MNVIAGPRHNLRHRLERGADLYLEDSCYALRSPARVTEFAQQLNLSREHLARQLSQEFGMSPREFLRARQLRRAQKLLRTTSLSTTDIAAACAFGTAPSFYRAFHAAFGMTPGEYRRRHITK